jgi:hypothetical protein
VRSNTWTLTGEIKHSDTNRWDQTLGHLQVRSNTRTLRGQIKHLDTNSWDQTLGHLQVRSNTWTLTGQIKHSDTYRSNQTLGHLEVRSNTRTLTGEIKHSDTNRWDQTLGHLQVRSNTWTLTGEIKHSDTYRSDQTLGQKLTGEIFGRVRIRRPGSGPDPGLQKWPYTYKHFMCKLTQQMSFNILFYELVGHIKRAKNFQFMVRMLIRTRTAKNSWSEGWSGSEHFRKSNPDQNCHFVEP